MSDLMKRENRGKMAIGAGGVVGGITLLSLTTLGTWHFLAPIVVGGLVIWGSWKLFQKPNSALVGMVGLVAGVLVAATAIPGVGLFASLLLNLSGIGLVAGGAWAIYQVFKSRRS